MVAEQLLISHCHRVTEQYVDLRSKCEILSCNMPIIEGGVVDMDADDAPDDDDDKHRNI